MDIVFKRIMIIDKNEKKAKIQSFNSGLNLVSSSNDSKEGNYNGKSTLLKSLYYTLGAEVFFDKGKGWQAKSKYYFVLDFYKDEELFTIIRNDHFFAVLNSEKDKLFSTYNRDELSDFYKDFFGTIPYLKSNTTKKYTKAAPFALFSLSFIDQKHYDGANFTSFSNQGEFTDYRNDIILFHLGINNNDFNKIIEEVNELEQKVNQSSSKLDIIYQLIKKAKESFDENYAQNYDSLKMELEKYKEQYSEIVERQNKIQKKLYSLYETKSRLLAYINELKDVTKKKDSNKILNDHKCPLCETTIANYVEVFFKKAKVEDEYSFQLVDCQSELEGIERSINLELDRYKDLTNNIQKLENIISKSQSEAMDMVKSVGFKKCIESMTAEYDSEAILLNDYKTLLKTKKESLRTYKEKISSVNRTYSDQLREVVRNNNITIIDLPESLGIETKITCSDPHVLSVIWLYVLNKIKKEVNKNGVFFPIIIDNPTDRDFDSNNALLVLRHAFGLARFNKQVFVSKVYFDDETIAKEHASSIVLTNPKYSLLNTSDFDEAENYLGSLLLS